MEQNVSCHFFGFTLPKSWRFRHEFRADVVVGTPDFPPPTSASGRRDSSAPCRWSCDGSSGTYFSLCRDSKPRLASCRSSSLPPNFHSGWNVSNEASRTFQSLWWFSRLRDVSAHWSSSSSTPSSPWTRPRFGSSPDWSGPTWNCVERLFLLPRSSWPWPEWIRASERFWQILVALKIKDTKFLSLVVSSNNFDLKLIDAVELHKYVNSLK